MNLYHIQVAVITPVSQTPFKVNFFYNETLQYEEWLMPWETGTSKKISFYMHSLKKVFDINQLQILSNTQNQHQKITIETVIVNDKIEKLPIHKQERKFQLKDIIESNSHSVIKIHDMNCALHASYSYTCNGHIYIPGSDIHQSELIFPDVNSNPQFTLDLFHKDITTPEKRFIFQIKEGQIIGKEIIIEAEKIQDIHQRLMNEFSQKTNNNDIHYHAILDIEELKFEDVILDDGKLSIPLKEFKSLNPKISISIYNSEDNKKVKSINFVAAEKKRTKKSTESFIKKSA